MNARLLAPVTAAVVTAALTIAVAIRCGNPTVTVILGAVFGLVAAAFVRLTLAVRRGQPDNGDGADQLPTLGRAFQPPHGKHRRRAGAR